MISTVLSRFPHPAQGFGQGVGLAIQVTGLHALVYARLVHLDSQAGKTREDGRERLCATHTAQTSREQPLAGRVTFVMLTNGLGKGLVGALHDALGTDVDPGSGRHLAEHHQAFLVQLEKVIPVGPVTHQVGVGDQHPRARARRS